MVKDFTKRNILYGVNTIQKNQKAKMRAAKIGKKLSEEHKKKISLNNAGSIAVDLYDLNMNFVQTFRTKRDAMKFMGYKKSSTTRINEKIESGKPMRGYYIKLHQEPVSTILGSEE